MADFFSKKIVLWREATKGVTPGTIAKAYRVTALNISLAETQKTETNPTLGNGGQASRTDYGASDFAGNLECKYTAGIMPILATHIIGTPVKTDAASGIWKASTVYTAGNIVNSVDGTKSLVCKVGGTTGTTEPVYAGLVDGATITDGTVVWVYRNKPLKKYVGSLSPCLETVGVESWVETGCATVTETFKERFTGVFFNSMEFSKSGGAVIHKYSIPAVAMGRVDSADTAWVEATITSEEQIVDRAFGYDDLKVLIGGVEPVAANAFRMTINRNTALEMGVAIDERIDNTPIVTVDGEVTLKFTPAQYSNVYNNPEKEVVLSFTSVNGDKGMFRFPAVENLRSPLTYATDRPIYLTSKLNAVGDSAVKTVTYEVISTTDW
jgi:hypothetical protein